MVTRLACSGHRGLPQRTERIVDEALRNELARRTDALVGLSCLADGADTLFAQALLDAGGTLIVVIPAAEYREGLPKWQHATYDALWARAAEVMHLDYTESDSRAHMAASEHMLSEADELIAVWDGKPARGYGGTADVVNAAQERGLPVTVVWPEGATRDSEADEQSDSGDEREDQHGDPHAGSV